MNTAGIAFLRASADELMAEAADDLARGKIAAFVERVTSIVDTTPSTGANVLEWQPFRAGVEICPLCATGNDGPAAVLLRYSVNGTVPHHTHGGDEHILVLRGSQTDERGLYPRGALVHNTPGSSHSVTSSAGCIVAIYWQKPVIFTSAAH